jgi:hypothetical protein
VYTLIKSFLKHFACIVALYTFAYTSGKCQSISQDVIAFAGENSKNTNGSLSWTIGEIETETINNSTTILTQGFQQGNISINSISELPGSEITIRVFPNPASSFVILEVDSKSSADLHFELYSLDGQLLLSRDLTTLQEFIDVQNLAPSIYILKVFNARNVFNVFEIVKH